MMPTSGVAYARLESVCTLGPAGGVVGVGHCTSIR